MEKKRDLDRAVRADPVQFPKRERIENAAYERVESLHARTQKNELILHTARNRLTGRMGDENGRAQWAIKAVEVPVSIGLSSAAAP